MIITSLNDIPSDINRFKKVKEYQIKDADGPHSVVVLKDSKCSSNLHGRVTEYEILKDVLEEHYKYGSFAKLPIEIIQKIFGYLTASDETRKPPMSSLAHIELLNSSFAPVSLDVQARYISENKISFKEMGLTKDQALALVKKLGDKLIFANFDKLGLTNDELKRVITQGNCMKIFLNNSSLKFQACTPCPNQPLIVCS